MDIVDLLARAQGGRGLESLGAQFGLDETQTRAAVEALAPTVAAGISRNAGAEGGLADLLGALLGSNHARYVEPDAAPDADAMAADGNNILGHIFGSKDVSRGVAQEAAGLSGLGAGLLKKMLPVIAAMVMGALAKRMTGAATRGDSGGGLGDILGDILGGGRSSRAEPEPRGGGLGDILGDILGGGTGPAPRSGGQGGLGDVLKDIFGGGAPDPARRPAQEEAMRRGRETLDEALGRRRSGNAADDLLNSVEEAIRRRR